MKERLEIHKRIEAENARKLKEWKEGRGMITLEFLNVEEGQIVTVETTPEKIVDDIKANLKDGFVMVKING